MDGYSTNNAEVLVVHCIDTEGPIGGDVRRRPDGSAEFYDNWNDIKASLKEIMDEDFRNQNQDSHGKPYAYNWFIMDFIGFKTNPKNRIAKHHDTYDNIKSLPNSNLDSFHWHYHQPPKSGIGDQWSDDWDNSDAHYDILGHRIIERNDFPEAFRAGGTIEDNKCSHWLEKNFLIDYSNRVSYRSEKTNNIFDFNWYNAPSHWGYYHPSHDDLTKNGDMKRYIVRCVDLESRLHRLQQWEVNNAFGFAKQYNCKVILSYFSHDHRDMREETRRGIELVRNSSKNYDIPYRWSGAKEALQIVAGIPTKNILVSLERDPVGAGHPKDSTNYVVKFSDEIYQDIPFVFSQDKSNNIIRVIPNVDIHNDHGIVKKCYCFSVKGNIKKIGIAGTSMSGDKFCEVYDL